MGYNDNINENFLEEIKLITLEDIKNDGTYNEDAFQREYKLLYSLNAKNCWKTLKQLKLQRNFEIK